MPLRSAVCALSAVPMRGASPAHTRLCRPMCICMAMASCMHGSRAGSYRRIYSTSGRRCAAARGPCAVRGCTARHCGHGAALAHARTWPQATPVRQAGSPGYSSSRCADAAVPSTIDVSVHGARVVHFLGDISSKYRSWPGIFQKRFWVLVLVGYFMEFFRNVS